MPGKQRNSPIVQEGHKTTIVEVAAHAGVSIKTVSRVINREPNVRANTRERVQSAIAELGYLPNSSARSLASKCSFSLGLLYQNPREFGYLRDLIDGVMAACEAANYALLMRPCLDKVDLTSIERFITQTRIDGAVLAAPICDNLAVTSLLTRQGVPFAQLAPSIHHNDWLSAQCADEQASYALTKHLLSLGHKRIGFIKGHPAHGASRKRLAGYTRAMQARGLPLAPSLIRQGFFEFESGKTCAEQLLRLRQRPTAIFASNDDMAAGVVFVARKLGFAIPDQLSVAGFDNSMVAERTWPPLTTIQQPIMEMAETLTHCLIRRLKGQPIAHTEADANYNCDLIVRSSTGPAPKRPL